METRKAILESIKDNLIILNESDDESIKVIDTKYNFAIKIRNWPDCRLSEIQIAMPESTLNRLREEFPESYPGYGEETLLPLLMYIMKHEDETWIVDTDPLSWHIRVGAVRDQEDAEDFLDHRLDEINSDEGEMFFILGVHLDDYMS